MKKLLPVILIIIMMVSFTACNKKQSDDYDKNHVNVYYINTKTSGIVSEKHKLINTDLEEQISELLTTLKKGPKNLFYKSVLPDKVTYKFTINKDNTLTIDFDSTYNELVGVDEILCRAAIVKTLCQLKGVDLIQIYVNGSPIDSNGDVVEALTATDFIDNTETNTDYKIKLYFANKKGDALVEYDSNINYSGTSTIEELAIQQLINGPTVLGMSDTIPEGTTLLNVVKSDGICTVDFNDKFLNKLPSVKENITIYSIVNTLVELPNISKVQFTIEGKVVNTLWDDMELDNLFERNLDLIEATE